MVSVVEHLAIRGRSVCVHVLLEARIALWLNVAGEETRAVQLEQWLEEISAAAVHDLLNLVVARVLPEALVVEVSLVELNGTAIIAEHELLERHEAHIPGVTLFISDKTRD